MSHPMEGSYYDSPMYARRVKSEKLLKQYAEFPLSIFTVGDLGDLMLLIAGDSHQQDYALDRLEKNLPIYKRRHAKEAWKKRVHLK